MDLKKYASICGFFGHINLSANQIQTRGSRVTFCWLDRVFFYVQIKKCAQQSAPTKEFHKHSDAWPEGCFVGLEIKHKQSVSPPYSSCHFNMSNLSKGSGDLKGMNELKQLQ